jgi:hypothetical protein
VVTTDDCPQPAPHKGREKSRPLSFRSRHGFRKRVQRMAVTAKKRRIAHAAQL